MDNAPQKKQVGYRVTDLPQMTDLNSNDLFLITHVKDEYGSYESQSVPFRRLAKAVKKRGFKEELETLAEINETYVDGDELAEELKKYSMASHDHDSAYSKLGHGHDAKEISGLDIPTKVSQLENDEGYARKDGVSISYSDVTKKITLDADGHATEIDASAFIKDGMVESARYDKETRLIVISFNTDAGRTPISVDVGGLVHEYSAGQGLKLDGSEFSVDSTVATKAWVEDKNYLTEHQSLDGYATEGWVGGKLTGYSPTSHNHDSAYSKLGHGHDVSDIEGLDIPTKVSELENDVPFLSAHQSLRGYATEDWVGKNFADVIHRHVASDVADFAESVQELTPKNVSDLKQDIPYLTEHQSLDGYATEGWVGGQGYATEKWVTSQGYIDAKSLEPYQKKTVFRDWTEEA